MGIKQRIKEIIFDHTRIDGIHDETTNKDLGIDSLDQVEIVMEIEKQFNITIQDEEIEKLRQFSDYVTLVEGKTT